MSLNTKISIVITTYNSANFIENAIKSVLAQSYTNFECIIIDDCSKDNTKDLVLPFLEDERISYVYQDNAGISATRNKGISLVSGDYLLFLDVDDLLPENAFSDLLNVALKHPKCDFVFGKSGETKGQNSNYHKTQRHDLPTGKPIENKQLHLLKSTFKNRVMNNVAWNKLYKLSFLKTHNLQFKEGIIHEDELWGFEILYHAKSIILNNTITYYYNVANDKSITKNYTLKNLKCFIVVINSIYDNYYTIETDTTRKNIIAAYLLKLKMLSIAHVYNKLTPEEKEDATDLILETFKHTKVNFSNNSFLRFKSKRRYNCFLKVQHMPPSFIHEYLSLTRKRSFNLKKLSRIAKMEKEAKA